MRYEIHYALLDCRFNITKLGTLENFETDIQDEDERKQAARTFAFNALGLTRGLIVQKVLPFGALDFLSSANDDEQEEEPEIGDEVTCHYCHQEFEYTGESSQQVGVDMYWCGCDE